MTVVKRSFNRRWAYFTGLSSDAKPTAGIGLRPGAQFSEINTGKVFTWSGSAWTERYQAFARTINGAGTWQRVSYPAAFPAGSTIRVLATPQDDNGTDYFVRVRNINLTGFQFIPRNHSGGVHTGAGVVGFLAIRSN